MAGLGVFVVLIRIHVTVGVVADSEGRVLVAQRPLGKSMAGAWELPGGKLEWNEGRLAGLARELREELGIEVRTARPLIRYKHSYAELHVDLDAWRVTDWAGEVQSLEGQALKWCSPGDLRGIALLSADGPIIKALELPSTITVTPSFWSSEAAFLDELECTSEGSRLVCLRRTNANARSMLALAARASCKLEGTGVRLLLHGDPVEILRELHELPDALRVNIEDTVIGLHVPARYLSNLSMLSNEPRLMLGVSCHDVSELDAAYRAGASYAFLGNVMETSSHPGRAGIGWQRFEGLIRDLPLPVYAIGGLGPEDLETAWAHGAQGIAAIRSLWPKD